MRRITIVMSDELLSKVDALRNTHMGEIKRSTWIVHAISAYVDNALEIPRASRKKDSED